MHPGDAVRRGELLRGLCLAAAFVLLGVCLLAAGRGMAAAEGIRITDAELPGGKGTLYLPRETAAVTLPAHEEGEETLSAGGMSSAALILSHWPDGARAAAAELCRRGVAVLTVPQGTDVRAAWDWLVSRPGVRGDSAAILAGDHRAPEALALAKALAGTPRECAALVLAGDKSLVKAAAGSPAANILLITGQEASPEELTAFYGAEADARRGFTGFFSEKTARAAAAVGGDDPAFYRRGVLTRALDWLGSSLGHRVELADGDLLWGKSLRSRAAGWTCFFPAAGALLSCRKKKQSEA